MQGVWNALIAVAGTLTGAVLTYVFGRRSAERAEQAAHRDQVRRDRLSAYLAFAEAVTEYRQAAYDLWHRQHDGSDEGVVAAASAEYYRCRSAAEHALLKTKLLTPGVAELVVTAHEALDAATGVRRAVDERQVTELGNNAARKADAFITAAANQVQ